jgi:hypothetical protein
MPSGISQIVPKAEAAWHQSLRSGAAGRETPSAQLAVRTNDMSAWGDYAQSFSGYSRPKQETQHQHQHNNSSFNQQQQQYFDQHSALYGREQSPQPSPPDSSARLRSLPEIQPGGTSARVAQNPSSFEYTNLGSDYPRSPNHEQQQGTMGPANNFNNSGAPSAGFPGPRSPVQAASPPQAYSLGREVVPQKPVPVTDGDLTDALESLQAARERHRQLMKEVYGKTLGPSDGELDATLKSAKISGFQATKHIAHPGARKAPAIGKAAAHQLNAEVGFLKTQLAQTANITTETSKRLANQMGYIKSEVEHINEEVARLKTIVDTMEESTAAAQSTVAHLRQELLQTRAQRDDVVRALEEFMSRTKKTVAEVQREMMTHETELLRLQQENEFFRVQAVYRRV